MMCVEKSQTKEQLEIFSAYLIESTSYHVERGTASHMKNCLSPSVSSVIT